MSGTARRAARAAAPYAVVLASFVSARGMYRQRAGVTFDSTPIFSYIQYFDPWFVEHDFWRSLLYLHHQAPLLNLLVGGALRWLGEPAAFEALAALWLLLGFGTAVGLLHAMLRLGTQPSIATATVSAYAAAPATVVFENWLIYHVPIAFLLVLALGALLAYQRRPTPARAAAFFWTLAIVGLFRSTFGPLFLLLSLGLLHWKLPFSGEPRRLRRQLWRAAALPLSLLALNSIKPQLLIGHGYGETMLWGNLVAKLRNELPPAELERLIQQGAVSRATKVFALTDLREFRELRVAQAPTGVPLLDLERTPNGRWNAHALEYLKITEKYYRPEAVYLLSEYPWTYVKSVGAALLQYTAPSTEDSMLPGTDAYRRVRAVAEPIDRGFGRRTDGAQWLLVLGLPALLAYALSRLTSRRATLPSQRRPTAALAFIVLTIGYVTAISVLISCGDFSRYRFDIDPLWCLLAVLLATELVSVTRSALHRTAGAVERLLGRRSAIPG